MESTQMHTLSDEQPVVLLTEDNRMAFKHGELMEQVWTGFYVPAVDQPLDLNEDGKMDVCFYSTALQNPLADVRYVNVVPTISSGTNPQRLSNTTSGEITWLSNIARTWTDKNYLYPIPENDKLMNPALEQNPGWENN